MIVKLETFAANDPIVQEFYESFTFPMNVKLNMTPAKKVEVTFIGSPIATLSTKDSVKLRKFTNKISGAQLFDDGVTLEVTLR
jgi:hypothetical protein